MSRSFTYLGCIGFQKRYAMRMSLVKTNTPTMKKQRTVLVHTVKDIEKDLWQTIAKVKGVYESVEHLMQVTGLHLSPDDGTLVTMNVYEFELDLPDDIKKWVKSCSPVSQVGENLADTRFVYAVIRNTDCTVGDGSRYIWILTSNETLASKVAIGNDTSGSDAEVVRIKLNTRINPRYPFHACRKK
jgi:hypothetical protein